MITTEDKIDQRFQVLLTEQEKRALERLAERGGISMGHVIRSEIRKLAKRAKVWE